jgi:[acyl-carrier-protein] S-malonyltransferase
MAFMFPGQGAHYIGMGKSLCERFRLANEIFDEADSMLGFGLKQLCFEGNLNELTKTKNTQPAVFVTGYAAFKVFMAEVGIPARCYVGHSLGEITALTCANAIRFCDAVKIVRERGKLMQEAARDENGIMAAISGVDRRTISEECEKISCAENIVVISNYNSPMQIVLSGHRKAVELVCAKLKELGGRATFLNVGAVFHSPLMQKAAASFGEVLKEYHYQNPEYMVLSNVKAKPYASADEIIPLLTEQIVKPVKWQESMKFLKQLGIAAAIELGPKNILTKLMAQNTDSIRAFSCETDKDIKDLSNKFGAVKEKNADKNGADATVVTRCLAIAVCTRNYNWDTQAYEQGVVQPYHKIQKIQEQLEQEQREPSVNEMREALEMLQGVFEVKGTPKEEQLERWEQIYKQTGSKLLFELDLLKRTL